MVIQLQFPVQQGKKNNPALPKSSGLKNPLKRTQFSDAALYRMSRYLNVLREFQQKDIPYISTSDLALQLGISTASVKQDFLSLRSKGRTGIGYEITELIEEFNSILLPDGFISFAIVGFGNIGQALANYKSLTQRGIKLQAIFDINPKLQTCSVKGIQVRDVEEIVYLCRELKIDAGAICTPSFAAQEAADLLIKGSVRGIWNFAPTEITVPDNIILIHEHILCGLYAISHRLGRKDQNSNEEEPHKLAQIHSRS